MKKLSSDLVFITLIKMVLNRCIFGANLPLFSYRLDYIRKRYPHRSLLLHFFRLCKYEKPLSLPSLGSLKLHRRMLPLCFLLTMFAYLRLWPNGTSMFLSTEPSEEFLICNPYNTLPLQLDTFGP
jgi:hypothetical protein